MSGSEESTVLIAGDERRLADRFAGWLGDRYQIRCAYDRLEAVAALDGDVDVVLLDWQMRGLHGDVALDGIVDSAVDPEIAVVTAVEPDFGVLERGFDDCVVVPTSPRELRATVERLLERRSYRDQIDEYAELLSERAALVTRGDRQQLDVSREFAELESRLDRLGARVDQLSDGFDENDFLALLHHLPTGRGY